MMWLEDFLRAQLRRLLTKQSHIALESKIPLIESRFQDIDELGLYLHIPFCRQICPYCPYNKEVYHPDLAKAYTTAVNKEIDVYSELVGNRSVTSFYIGGGTPQRCFTVALARFWSMFSPPLTCGATYIWKAIQMI